MFIVCGGYIANTGLFYPGTTVKKLEKETYKAERKIDLYQKNNWNLPENYESLVEFLEIQRRGTKKFIGR